MHTHAYAWNVTSQTATQLQFVVEHSQHSCSYLFIDAYFSNTANFSISIKATELNQFASNFHWDSKKKAQKRQKVSIIKMKVWKVELNDLLERIERHTAASLWRIKREFERSGLTFDRKFRKRFLRLTNNRWVPWQSNERKNCIELYKRRIRLSMTFVLCLAFFKVKWNIRPGWNRINGYGSTPSKYVHSKFTKRWEIASKIVFCNDFQHNFRHFCHLLVLCTNRSASASA